MASNAEHFVTLFDSAFLSIGMALHGSLSRHAQPFYLWVLCMDEEVERSLRDLALPGVRLVPLREVEHDNPELRAVKLQRTRREYCWTLSPFTFDAVMSRDAQAHRVTYLDADVFFFADPRLLLSELDASGRHVLVTEHAYDPRYDQSQTSGRFCVQFLTMDRSTQADRVRAWWQRRVIESCSETVEDGKFGDQKYVDQWPELFGEDLRILADNDRIAAPWNALKLDRPGAAEPVMYHFHGLRLVAGDRAILYTGYRVGPAGLALYHRYLHDLAQHIELLRERGLPVHTQPPPTDPLRWLRKIKWAIQRTHRVAPLPKHRG